MSLPLAQFAFTAFNIGVPAEEDRELGKTPPTSPYSHGQKSLYLSKEVLGPRKLSTVFMGRFYEEEALLGKCDHLTPLTLSVIISWLPGPSSPRLLEGRERQSWPLWLSVRGAESGHYESATRRWGEGIKPFSPV